VQYVLLTPIKNEEQFLPLLAEMLLRQTVQPALWLLVNDASTDGSRAFIDGLVAAHNWVFSITMPYEPGGLGLHYARVVDHGFNVLQAEAARRGISYDLLGKVDADVIFDETCFAYLLAEFAANERLGVASPSLTNADVDSSGNVQPVKKEVVLADHPTDGIRLFRRTCFEEIGGSPVTRAPETVAEAKATLRGWKLQRFVHIEAYHRRKAHSATPLWSRWEMAGSEQHYLGYHPLLVLGHACYELLFHSPKYLFIAHLAGYCKAVLRREEVITDDEVRAYFGRQRLGEVWKQLPALIKQAMKR
jgi:glycosyltransferase involved in cell wall biosynthesis